MNGGLFSDEDIKGPFPEGICSLLHFIGASRLQAFHALRSVPSLNVNRMSSLLWTVVQSAGVYQVPSLDLPEIVSSVERLLKAGKCRPCEFPSVNFRDDGIPAFFCAVVSLREGAIG